MIENAYIIDYNKWAASCKKQALKSLSVPYYCHQPIQAFFYYDTYYEIKLCCLQRLYFIVSVIPSQAKPSFGLMTMKILKLVLAWCCSNYKSSCPLFTTRFSFHRHVGFLYLFFFFRYKVEDPGSWTVSGSTLHWMPGCSSNLLLKVWFYIYMYISMSSKIAILTSTDFTVTTSANWFDNAMINHGMFLHWSHSEYGDCWLIYLYIEFLSK